MEEEVATLSLWVNGERVVRTIPVRLNLADFLRQELELTGTHVGCEHGVCGACTVVVDGRCARSCLLLAAQLEGARVETIEGASASGRLKHLQEAFYHRAALQCGFCTPAMLLTAAEFLGDAPAPSRSEIREALSGNYCRCTGYEAIIDAVETAAKAVSRDG